jgi:hypothetical protein
MLSSGTTCRGRDRMIVGLQLPICNQYLSVPITTKVVSSNPAVLSQLPPTVPRAGVIYSRLFKYIQQHTAGLTDNHWASHLLMSFLGRSLNSFSEIFIHFADYNVIYYITYLFFVYFNSSLK